MAGGAAQRLCPSASPEQPGAAVFGVAAGAPSEPRVAYLREPLPVVPRLLDLVRGVDPREVFRTAAPCAESACQHFDGATCSLVTRVVAAAPIVVDELPPCPIRRDCRWFHQEHRAACERCPQVVTLAWMASDALRAAANPPIGASPEPDVGRDPPPTT